MASEYMCVRCKQAFVCDVPRGYCDGCVKNFRDMRSKVNNAQQPEPNVCADGKFVDGKECPETVVDADRTICGLCGSDQIEPGYGLGTGHGVGSYNFCMGCLTFLDFKEDME